ncbi:MAG: hypothetical protein WC527_00010 [Candidatus Margulisiibacteriota bacterium]
MQISAVNTINLGSSERTDTNKRSVLSLGRPAIFLMAADSATYLLAKQDDAPQVLEAAPAPVKDQKVDPSSVEADNTETKNKETSKWDNPLTWFPSAPIDINNAKYTIKPHWYSPKLYSEDGIKWYRERKLWRPYSWFYTPYPMDQRNDEVISKIVKDQDVARIKPEEKTEKTPEIANEIINPEIQTPEKTAETGLTRLTVAIPLTEEEKKQVSWYNPLGKMGYRMITKEEIKQLPSLSLGKLLLGWY